MASLSLLCSGCGFNPDPGAITFYVVSAAEEISRNQAEIYFHDARQASWKGRHEEAAHLFTLALTDGRLPKSLVSAAYRYRAREYEELYLPEKAIPDLTIVIASNGRYADRGYMYLLSGQRELAIRDFMQNVSPPKLLAAGLTELMIGDPIKAEQYFSEHVGQYANDWRARIWLFVVRHRLGKRDVKGLELALLGIGDERDPWPRRTVGLFLNRYGISDFQTELEKFRPVPTEPVQHICQSWVFLGQRYLVLGDRRQAAEAFRRAIDMKGGSGGCGSMGVIARMEYRRVAERK